MDNEESTQSAPESVIITLGGVDYTVSGSEGSKIAVNVDGKTFALSNDETAATQVVADEGPAETYVKGEDGTWAIKSAVSADAGLAVGGRRSRRRRSRRQGGSKKKKGWGGSKKQKKRKGSKKRR
jgi:hypothetical protein